MPAVCVAAIVIGRVVFQVAPGARDGTLVVVPRFTMQLPLGIVAEALNGPLLPVPVMTPISYECCDPGAGVGVVDAGLPDDDAVPLIDGFPEKRSTDSIAGKGETLESRSYPGQGGGFVSFDSHLNYEVTKARRDLAVDMRPAGGADSVAAVHDSFADSASHTYAWQLAPEAGTAITFGEEEAGARTFLFKKGAAG